MNTRIAVETTMGTDTGAASPLKPTRLSQPVASYGHPLVDQAFDVCHAIEACGGSPELTNAMNRASALVVSIANAIASRKYLVPAEDEPTFTLRAQDKSAPFCVMKWAETASQHGVAPDKVVGAQKIAFEMIEWQQRHGCKIPD